MTDNELSNGRVARVIGPVVDVEFPPEGLPEIHTALTVDVTLEGELDALSREFPRGARPHQGPDAEPSAHEPVDDRRSQLTGRADDENRSHFSLG